MSKKKVLIAFDSPTMRTILAKQMQKLGYATVLAEDGIEALKKVYTESPDLLLVYYELPAIDAYSLTRTIKNAHEFSDICVIVCGNEETSVHRFWASNSKSNGFIIIDDQLATKADEVYISYSQNIPKRKATVRPEPDLTQLITFINKTYDYELFTLYQMQNAYKAASSTFDISDLLQYMASTVAGVFNYDALGILVNDDSLSGYFEHIKTITKKDYEDFKHICQSDFKEKVPNRKEYLWQNTNTIELDVPTKNTEEIKLKSYEVFPRDRNGIFTLHLANATEDAFNSRTLERLDFFIEIYEPVVAQVIEFNKKMASEKKIRQAFSRFLPDKVIDNFIEGNKLINATMGEKRQVAVLITDIRDFTPLSEINPPESVVTFLNYYFSIMGSIIKKHGGTIDKFMGDAIMALFGAAESFEDNGNRAAKAALEMMQAVKTLDTSMLVMPKGYSFKTGIGIHYGKPIVGAIGSAEKKEYTVIGDDVNLSSRIESLTKLYDSHIIITDSVVQDLRGEYIIRQLDTVKVKGKSIPVKIYELTDENNTYTSAFTQAYKKGLNQYEIGNFDNAASYFDKALQEYPDNKSAKVLYTRCMEFNKNKPVDWDGAFTLTTK
ncbi:MAG: response regulator [Treponema sp.]|nr:response regulator [Treponema sp.]